MEAPLTPLKFTAAQFMSDREIDKSIRDIFPEWKELLEELVDQYAKHSQKLFDAWYKSEIENASTVYGDPTGDNLEYWGKLIDEEQRDTHTAKLVNVQEIEK